MKKTLWIITELYHPENNQTGYYMTGIGEGLKEDFDVKVICSQPNYALRGTKAPARELHNGVEIFRVRGTTLDKNVMVFRLINMLTNGLSVLFSAVRRIKPGEQVLTVSAPPSLPFIAAAAARFRNSEFSLIIQDKYPEQLVAVKKMRNDSTMIGVLKRMNQWLYSRARKIIVVGRDMEQLVNKQLTDNDGGSKIDVIPNWAALEEVEPMPKAENSLLQRLSLTEKFIFLYAGNMGPPQDVESILECATRLRHHVDIRFVFIGGGVKRALVKKEIEKRELTNVFLLDEMPREEQSIFLNACDVGFVSLVTGMYGLAMPSRTYNLLAAGKPILAITERDSEVDRVVREEQVGWSVEPENPDLLLRAILEAYESRDRFVEMSKRARNAAITKYSGDESIAKYRRSLSPAKRPN